MPFRWINAVIAVIRSRSIIYAACQPFSDEILHWADKQLVLTDAVWPVEEVCESRQKCTFQAAPKGQSSIPGVTC